MDKFLTIIVTNKNDSATLLRQLNSIVNQTMLPNELIITDDGSDDNSVDIIYNFKNQHHITKLPIKIIINKENCGVARRVNEATDIANSEYLFFGSANDYLLPTFVENCYRGYLAHKPAIISCTSLFPQDRFYIGHELIPPVSYYIPGHSSLVKKENLIEFGKHIIELEWHCDWFFFHGIALKYGWYGIPQELSIKTPNEFGYANHGVKTGKQLSIINNMVKIVNSEECFKYIKDGMMSQIKKLPRGEEVISTY
jgi:glycosyltransferase involved in cell wall biosynthesis